MLFSHCKCPHHFRATRDDKINDCGIKFSVACEWSVLIEEDKDDSLQFAKVFSAKFLKLPIRQSFSPPLFCTIRVLVSLIFIAIPTPFSNLKFIFTSSKFLWPLSKICEGSKSMETSKDQKVWKQVKDCN